MVGRVAGGIMLRKMRSVLRWAGAAALGAALAIWLAAVAFALLGFRRTAEAIADALYDVLPVAEVPIVIADIKMPGGDRH